MIAPFIRIVSPVFYQHLIDEMDMVVAGEAAPHVPIFACNHLFIKASELTHNRSLDQRGGPARHVVVEHEGFGEA